MIDIIIPIYNPQLKDLKRCLKSIENQTYKEYIVYLIDDGSNNEIKDYLDSYISNKNKYIVKHINNNGVSNARNTGIELSSSKYISFIDADDTIEADFLQEALNYIENNNLDLIIGGYNEIHNNQIIRTRISLPGLHIYDKNNINNFLTKLLSGKTNDSNKEIGDCPTGRIYTRLFRRESIESLRFNTNIHISEDTLFMIDYTKQINRIGIIDKIWYNYYINDYSLSRSSNKEQLINNIKEFIKEIEERNTKESNPLIKDAYQARIEKANKYINEVMENK